MKELFVPYGTNIQLREKGLNFPCIGVIWPDGEVYVGSLDFIKIMTRKDSTCMPVPTYSQVVDWFRGKHGVIIESPIPTAMGYLPHIYKDFTLLWQGQYFEDFYEALDTAINHAITLLP